MSASATGPNVLANGVISGVAALAGDIVNSLVGEPIRGGGRALRAEWWIRSGKAGQTILEVYDKLTSEEPDMLSGFSHHAIARIMEAFIRAACYTTMVAGELIGESIFAETMQEGVSNAIQTVLGGAIQSIANYWRGSSPLSIAHIDDVGEAIEDIDVDTATLLGGQVGLNLQSTHFMLKRGLDRYVDTKISLLRYQMRDILERMNDSIRWLHERIYTRSLREFESVIDSIHHAYNRGITLYDLVIERALSRIQEIRGELETLKVWWDYTQQHPEMPLTDEETVRTTAEQDSAELDAIYQTVEKILSTIDNTLEKLSINVKDVIDRVDDIMEEYSKELNRMIRYGAISIDDLASKIYDTMVKISACRHKTDAQTTIALPLSQTVKSAIIGVPASGLDPNDPTWCPAEGWTKIWQFMEEAELDDYANYAKKDAQVDAERGVVVFTPPTSDYGVIDRYITDRHFKRIAICFRVDIIQPVADRVIVNAISSNLDANKSIDTGVFSSDNPDKLRIWDNVKAQYYEISHPKTWMVFVVDFTEQKARLYDQNKNLLIEVLLDISSPSETSYECYAVEQNQIDSFIDDVEVDWIAVLEASSSQQQEEGTLSYEKEAKLGESTSTEGELSYESSVEIT